MLEAKQRAEDLEKKNWTQNLMEGFMKSFDIKI
jgi:hypothetical protein